MAALENKVALITGATSGIGREAALTFAREGAKVVVAGRRTERGEEVVRAIRTAGGDALFVRVDVTSASDLENLVAKTVESYGALHVAVNNAGVSLGFIPILDLPAEDYEKTFDVNVKGVWMAMRAELPAILRSGGGSIVNIASIAGTRGVFGATLYGASKAAVIAMSQSAALELAQSKVRVNVLSPGPIVTDMLNEAFGGDEEVAKQFAGQVPVGRFGTVDEVAAGLVYLASDASSYVTGQNLLVDGGWTAR